MNRKTLEILKKLKTRDQGNKQVPMPAFSLFLQKLRSLATALTLCTEDRNYNGCIQGMEINKIFPIELELIC